MKIRHKFDGMLETDITRFDADLVVHVHSQLVATQGIQQRLQGGQVLLGYVWIYKDDDVPSLHLSQIVSDLGCCAGSEPNVARSQLTYLISASLRPEASRHASLDVGGKAW